jgi:hemerythrin superfamily protein
MVVQSGPELKSKIAGAAAETKALLAGETGIYKRLIAEHAELLSLAKTVQETAESEGRAQAFARLKSKLTLHNEAEEKEFYTLLEQRPETQETVQIQVDEHRVTMALVNTLQNLEPTSAEWDELMGKLRTLLCSHVEREENDLFEQSKPAIGKTDSEEIESRFVERKVEEAARLDEPRPQEGKYELPLP